MFGSATTFERDATGRTRLVPTFFGLSRGGGSGCLGVLPLVALLKAAWLRPASP